MIELRVPLISPLVCLVSFVLCFLSCVFCLPALMSFVFCLLSSVVCLVSCVLCLCLVSCVACLVSLVACRLSNIACRLSNIACRLSLVFCFFSCSRLRVQIITKYLEVRPSPPRSPPTRALRNIRIKGPLQSTRIPSPPLRLIRHTTVELRALRFQDAVGGTLVAALEAGPRPR